MKIGGKYKFSEVMARHWEQFALDAALSPAQVKKRILGNGHPIIDRIVTLIDQRCALTVRRLTVQQAGGVSQEST